MKSNFTHVWVAERTVDYQETDVLGIYRSPEAAERNLSERGILSIDSPLGWKPQFVKDDAIQYGEGSYVLYIRRYEVKP